MNNLLLIYTTISDKHCAEKIARKIIKDKLAACVSIKEINSFYFWDDCINNEIEYELTIKSKPEKLDILINFLKIEVEYKIPQIIYKIFESENNYYEWAKKSIN